MRKGAAQDSRNFYKYLSDSTNTTDFPAPPCCGASGDGVVSLDFTFLWWWQAEPLSFSTGELENFRKEEAGKRGSLNLYRKP